MAVGWPSWRRTWSRSASLIAVVGLVLLIGISMYAAAAGMYMRTILYRYATAQRSPDLGVDVGRASSTPVTSSPTHNTADQRRGRRLFMAQNQAITLGRRPPSRRQDLP